MEPTLSLTCDNFIYDANTGEAIEFPKVGGVVCPIDGNNLYSVEIGGFKRWECLACGAIYRIGDGSISSLRTYANVHLNNLENARTIRKRAGHSIDVIFESGRKQWFR